MIISFDLDDTLIPGAKTFATENRSMFQRLLAIEEIRIGAIGLIKACQLKGHKVYIYTTSLRSVRKIRWMFYTYGVSLDKVINQKVHDRAFRNENSKPSKYPPAFHIDIHVDDSIGVEMEGLRFNFRTVIISQDDVKWTDNILQILD
jgi:hypothetical protein